MEAQQNAADDPTLVPWLLSYIDATQSSEGLWYVTDVIAQDKNDKAAYLTPKVLAKLRAAVARRRSYLAAEEHKQNTESRASLPSE